MRYHKSIRNRSRKVEALLMNGTELLSSYRFFFTYGSLKAGFQKISGIGGRTEPEYIHEGGQSCAYPLPGTGGSRGVLTMEKGHGLCANPFYLNGGFTPGTRISAPCSIILMGEDNSPKRVFAFDYGMIVSWECSPLDATGGELLIDKLEIAHTGIHEVSLSPSYRY